MDLKYSTGPRYERPVVGTSNVFSSRFHGQFQRKRGSLLLAIAMHGQRATQVFGAQRGHMQPKPMALFLGGKPLGENLREMLGLNSHSIILHLKLHHALFALDPANS